jgi:hypothetical protein
MKPLVRHVVFWLVILYSLFMFERLTAYEILEPTTVTIIGEYYDAHRDPYITEDNGDWVYGAGLGAKFTLFGDRQNNYRLFYDPTLSFKGTSAQIREGGLDYQLGFEAFYQGRGFKIYRNHSSHHVLERGRDNKAFPLTDSWKAEISWEVK